MTLIKTDIDHEIGVKYEYYKQDNGSYAFTRSERYGATWVQISEASRDWSRDALEFEHDIKLPA